MQVHSTGSGRWAPLPPIDIVLTVDTAPYAITDLVAAPQLVQGAFLGAGGISRIVQARLIDKDNQTAFTSALHFLDDDVSMGAENAGPDMSDADVGHYLGNLAISSTSVVSLSNNRVYTVLATGGNIALPLLLTPKAGTMDVWVAMTLTTGSPTFASGALDLRLWLEAWVA